MNRGSKFYYGANTSTRVAEPPCPHNYTSGTKYLPLTFLCYLQKSICGRGQYNGCPSTYIKIVKYELVSEMYQNLLSLFCTGYKLGFI